METEIESIIVISTVFITLLCGFISRKVSWFSNNLIPIQNILIGLSTALIYYLFTKNLSLAIATAGLFTGGIYDVANNLKKIFDIDESEG